MQSVSTALTTVSQWFGIVVMVAIAWRVARSGGSTAVSELSQVNHVLEDRVHKLGAEVRDLRVENAELRARTDFAAVIGVHEERAAERAEKTLAVLDLIASRLGPEGDCLGSSS
jgi:hypothetical protein